MISYDPDETQKRVNMIFDTDTIDLINNLCREYRISAAKVARMTIWAFVDKQPPKAGELSRQTKQELVAEFNSLLPDLSPVAHLCIRDRLQTDLHKEYLAAQYRIINESDKYDKALASIGANYEKRLVREKLEKRKNTT